MNNVEKGADIWIKVGQHFNGDEWAALRSHLNDVLGELRKNGLKMPNVEKG